MTKIASLMLLTASLAFATPALAAGGGVEGAAHHYYTDDDDNDGIPNWLDRYNGDVLNEDTFRGYALGFHAFNLLVLFMVLGYFGRRPIGDFLTNRAFGIRKELTDAAKAKDAAEERYRELSSRLQAISDEVNAMRADAETEARADHARLIERANAEAKRIEEGAERNLRDEVQRARLELRREAVQLAVQLAEQTLRERASSAHHQALARDFLQSLNHDGANHV